MYDAADQGDPFMLVENENLQTNHGATAGPAEKRAIKTERVDWPRVRVRSESTR